MNNQKLSRKTESAIRRSVQPDCSATDGRFMEDLRGVHYMDNEHTLCGDAFDAWSTESDWEGGEMKPTHKRTITCPECARLILDLRGIRVRLPNAKLTALPDDQNKPPTT